MREFIVESDWWTDCDDAVAFRILARAARAGQVKLRGILLNACMEDSAASLIGFLRAEGLSPLPPVGIDREATDFGGAPPYQKRLARLCVPRVSNEELEDAAHLYVRLLTEAKEPVELIQIGYPQVMTKVLTEHPDLFRQKIKKIWMMAGKWDTLPGRENNFARSPRSRAAAHLFCKNCPVPVVFLGWEVACDILTGGGLSGDDPLHAALCDHGSACGRSSWDPMLAELALIGDPARAGYRTVTGTASVDPVTGENDFRPHPDGIHCYVVKALPDDEYRRRIDHLIQSKW